MKLVVSLSIMVVGLFVHTAHAQQVVGPTTIVQLVNGWGGEQFAVIVAAGTSTCPGGANEYTVRSTHGAYKEIVAMALAAFASDARIVLRVDGTCVDNNRAAILELRLIK